MTLKYTFRTYWGGAEGEKAKLRKKSCEGWRIDTGESMSV